MSKKWIKLGIGLGILTLGAVYLGKKTGLLEDDRHLYDEFESIQLKKRIVRLFTCKILEESQ